jgi:hypothetical protein
MNISVTCVISFFQRGVNDVFALWDVASLLLLLLVVTTDVSGQRFPSSSIKQSKKSCFFFDCLTLEDGIYKLSRNVGSNYQSPLRNIPEERGPHQCHNGAFC